MGHCPFFPPPPTGDASSLERVLLPKRLRQHRAPPRSPDPPGRPVAPPHPLPSRLDVARAPPPIRRFSTATNADDGAGVNDPATRNAPRPVSDPTRTDAIPPPPSPPPPPVRATPVAVGPTAPELPSDENPLSGDARALSSSSTPRCLATAGACESGRGRGFATWDGVDVWPVTLGARDAKCRVRFAIGDALRLASVPPARDTDVPTGGDGENSAARSGFSPDPDPWPPNTPPEPPAICSFFSGLTLVDDRVPGFPVRVLRGTGPRGRATGEGLPPRLSGFGIGDSKNTRSPSPPSELLRLERGWLDPDDRRPTRGEGD